MLQKKTSLTLDWLVAYFGSGWAFLVPYLLLYLLYFWQQWPVNVSPLSTAESGNHIPALLHAFWFLHAAHLSLGTFTLVAWWRRRVSGEIENQQKTKKPQAFHRFWPVLSWLLLGLLFWIPGVYLEWPSDPWEHLRRINEWRSVGLVGAHSTWYKSSYFFGYSLIGESVGTNQLFWLDFYHTGVCLLLCWQYYLLARACSLGKRTSMVFVMFQALFLGNSVFSFYRYYGLSSSIFAQLGAVALTRLVLQLATARSLVVSGASVDGTNQNQCATQTSRWGPFPVHILLLTISSIFLLLLLIVFNHLQGFGIAALGIGAVAIWRVMEIKRSAVWLLLAGAIVASVIALGGSTSNMQLYEAFRSQGYFNSWFGFNILSLNSAAGDRMLQIVGVTGLFSVLAALILLRRNHVIGWLTLFPFFALILPCISIPLARALERHADPSNIITFQRMLFAMPTGLAPAALFANLFSAKNISVNGFVRFAQRKPSMISLVPIGASVLLLLAVTSFSPGKPVYNHAWHAFALTPHDLELKHIVRISTSALFHPGEIQPAPVISRNISSEVFHAFGLVDLKTNWRITNETAADCLSATTKKIDPVRDSRKRGDPIPAAPIAKSNYLQLSDGVSLLSVDPTPRRPTYRSDNLFTELKAPGPSDWISLGGPEAIMVQPSTSSYVLKNAPGASCYIFTRQLIPISPNESYLLTIRIKQLAGSTGSSSLAVAWYDESNKLLISNKTVPGGGGFPDGWSNGTYSYFGLVERSTPPEWTTYQVTFGWAQEAAIPRQAKFVRAGALLNYNSVPSAVVELADVSLTEIYPPTVKVILASDSNLYSTGSQAALLSKHWSPQQVSIAHAGENEIRDAARPGYLSQ